MDELTETTRIALAPRFKHDTAEESKTKAAQRLRLLRIDGFIETWHPGNPAAIRQHQEDEPTPRLACNLARAAHQVRNQLRTGSTSRVPSGSVAARVMSGTETATGENRGVR